MLNKIQYGKLVGMLVGENTNKGENPTSNGFDIKSNCTDNCSVKVQITNITGQLIMTKDCDLLLGNCFVNTTLPNGNYLVKITKSSSQESVISKLTINNY